MFTGLTANCAVKNRAHRNVVAGIESLVQSLPYPMTGLDFDNGGEFINVQLIEWAERQHIELTRARAYQHNDNAHVEQRNRDWVRRHAFRYRYEGPEELAILNELWQLVGWRKNHLLPMVKANGYGTARSGRSKRTYDAPRTAYQRLLDLGAMDEAHAQALAAVHRELNPAQITRQINQIQSQLMTRAKLRARADGVEFSSLPILRKPKRLRLSRNRGPRFPETGLLDAGPTPWEATACPREVEHGRRCSQFAGSGTGEYR